MEINLFFFCFRKFLQLISAEEDDDDEDLPFAEIHSDAAASTSSSTEERNNNKKRKRRRQSFSSQELSNIKIILKSSTSMNNPQWYYYYVKRKFKLRINNNGNDDDDDDDVLVNNDTNRVIISKEKVFDTIHAAHIACGHGGEKRTYYEIRNPRHIANVTVEQIKMYLSLCETCKKKKNILRKINNGSRNIISSSFGERGQIDLIDLSMYRTVDGYKYILNYQDHLTKFIMLKPLKSKGMSEVNEALLDIFTTLGAPEILQCDNGTEFSGIRTDLLAKYWPHCKLIHSRPRHPQSQGSIERANGDVMNMLRSWLGSDNNSSSSWVKGLKFVQLQKNNSYNRSINCSPFKAVFGREMPVVFNDGFADNDDYSYNDNNFSNEHASLLPPSNDNISEEENNIDDVLSLSDNDCDDISLVLSLSDNDDDDFSLVLSDDDEENNNNVDSVTYSSPPREDISNNIMSVKTVRERISQQLLKNSNVNSGIDDKEEEIIEIGTPVILKIPKMDTHKLGFPNVVGVVYKYLPDVTKYKIKTRHGIVNRVLSKEDFEVCPNLNIDININEEIKSLSLREIARLDSIKFVGCQCHGRCQNKRCFCFRNNRACGNLCKHKCCSDICLNKIFEKKMLRTRTKK